MQPETREEEAGVLRVNRDVDMGDWGNEEMKARSTLETSRVKGESQFESAQGGIEDGEC